MSIIICGIALYFLMRIPRSRENYYQKLKDEFGRGGTADYNKMTLRELIIDLNNHSKLVLGMSEFVTINIDKYCFPLIKGIATGTTGNWTGMSSYSARAIYLLSINPSDANYFRSHNDMFKIADEFDKVLVVWVTDVERLYNYLKENIS